MIAGGGDFNGDLSERALKVACAIVQADGLDQPVIGIVFFIELQQLIVQEKIVHQMEFHKTAAAGRDGDGEFHGRRVRFSSESDMLSLENFFLRLLHGCRIIENSEFVGLRPVG